MLACGTGCHMSNFVVIEQELDEKFEVAHCPRRVSIPRHQLTSPASRELKRRAGEIQGHLVYITLLRYYSASRHVPDFGVGNNFPTCRSFMCSCQWYFQRVKDRV
jgi:hypothetical protein